MERTSGSLKTWKDRIAKVDNVECRVQCRIKSFSEKNINSEITDSLKNKISLKNNNSQT